MSRIGKLPVAVPDKVKAQVVNGLVKIEGPKGKLEKSFNPLDVDITLEGQEIKVAPANKSRRSRAMWGTARSIIQGMVDGVTNGFEKNLTITGVGFRAAVKGKALDLALGYSHPIAEPIPDGLTVAVQDSTKVKVTGPDKQTVGQFAANVRAHYPAEPYKCKGVAIDGQFVRRKEGKKAG